MTPKTIRLISAALALTSLSLALADPPTQTPAEKYAWQIHNAHDGATWAAANLADLTGGAQQAPLYTKNDLVLITKYMQEMAQSYNAAAAAYEKGDEAAAKIALDHANDLDRRRSRWNMRLDWRLQEVRLVPAEDNYDATLAYRPVAFVNNFIESRKRAAEAFSRLADATTPDTDPATLDALRDAAANAMAETQIAEMQMNWAGDDGDAMDPAVTSPQLDAIRQKIRALRKEREDLFLKQAQDQRSVEKVDDQYRALNDQFHQIFHDTKEAMNQPK